MLRLLWIVGLVGIGCSTTIVTPRQLSVSGDYPLSSSDIRAIEALVDARPDIAKPLQSIYTDAEIMLEHFSRAENITR